MPEPIGGEGGAGPRLGLQDHSHQAASPPERLHEVQEAEPPGVARQGDACVGLGVAEEEEGDGGVRRQRRPEAHPRKEAHAHALY